jgi:hypothetical protein
MRNVTKGIRNDSFILQNVVNPVIVIDETVNKEFFPFIASLLDCWNEECSLHKSLMSLFCGLKRPLIFPEIGVKGEG